MNRYLYEITLRRFYHRDLYRFYLNASLVVLCLNIVLISINVFWYLDAKNNAYYITSNNGYLYQINALGPEIQNMSYESRKKWIADNLGEMHESVR